jgi:uncharacterized protein YxeA
MDILIIILILIAIAIIALFIFQDTNLFTKSPSKKRGEIYLEYEKELQNILNKYKDNPTQQLSEKKIFLKKCSSELSRNIFFTPAEAKKIIEKLVKL